MRSLIKIYKISPGRPQLMPIEKMSLSEVTFSDCYRITVGYGERNRERSKHGNRDSYVMTETIDTYYIGTVVPESEVKQTKLFGTCKDDGSEMMYIRLSNGQFMKIKDTSLVINPNRLVDAKLIDLFDPDFYIGLHN